MQSVFGFEAAESCGAWWLKVATKKGFRPIYKGIKVDRTHVLLTQLPITERQFEG